MSADNYSDKKLRVTWFRQGMFDQNVMHVRNGVISCDLQFHLGVAQSQVNITAIVHITFAKKMIYHDDFII